MPRARKTSTCEILKTTSRGKYKFELSAYGPDGARTRKFFLTRQEAELERERRLKAWAMPEHAIEPTRAEREALKEARAHGVDLKALVAEAVAAKGRAAVSVTVAEAVTAWIQELERSGRGKRHIGGIRAFFGPVIKAWPEIKVSDITSEMVGSYIHDRKGISDITRANYRRHFKELFSASMRHGWCAENPVLKLKAPRIRTHSDHIAILTPDQARRMLASTAEHAPRLLPAVAIGLFAGVRSAELQRLTWADVWLNRGVLVVAGGKAKTGNRRMVAIQPPLAAILESLRPEDGTTPIWPVNGLKMWDRAIKGAGWRGHIHWNPKPVPGAPLAPEWPSNALRHSFVSYHVAGFRNAAETALESGHSLQVLHRHYRELAMEDEAAEFWTAGFLG